MLWGGKTLGLGLPLYLLGGQLLFVRDKGGCFVWVPKPKGEERSVGAEGGRGFRGFLKGLQPFQAWQGRRGSAAWGRGWNPSPFLYKSICFPALLKWIWRGGDGRHWWNLNKFVNCLKNSSK